MKALTIQELSCYLPYGLKICYRVLDLENGDPTTGNPDDRMKDCIMVMNSARLDRCLLPGTDRWYDKNSIFKPLLIPMSELTDTNAYEDIARQCEHRMVEEYYHVKLEKNYSPLGMPYWVFKILLEYHFDVFDLIGNCLALNKTDLKEK